MPSKAFGIDSMVELHVFVQATYLHITTLVWWQASVQFCDALDWTVFHRHDAASTHTQHPNRWNQCSKWAYDYVSYWIKFPIVCAVHAGAWAHGKCAKVTENREPRKRIRSCRMHVTAEIIRCLERAKFKHATTLHQLIYEPNEISAALIGVLLFLFFCSTQNVRRALLISWAKWTMRSCLGRRRLLSLLGSSTFAITYKAFIVGLMLSLVVPLRSPHCCAVHAP